jgi:hypothetical protein
VQAPVVAQADLAQVQTVAEVVEVVEPLPNKKT